MTAFPTRRDDRALTPRRRVEMCHLAATGCAPLPNPRALAVTGHRHQGPSGTTGHRDHPDGLPTGRAPAVTLEAWGTLEVAANGIDVAAGGRRAAAGVCASCSRWWRRS